MTRDWEHITRIDHEKRAEEMRTGTLPDDEYILTCRSCGERQRTFSVAYRDHWMIMHDGHDADVLVREAPDAEVTEFDLDDAPDAWGGDGFADDGENTTRTDPPF